MKNNNYWYAVMADAEDQDWGTGSYDYNEAVNMVQQYIQDGGYIAVIEESENDSICVDEIHDF